jgi:hypothetical protein
MNAESPGMQAAPTKKQHTFMVQHRDENGALIEGQFTTKRLSIREFTAVTVRKIVMNGGYHWDEKHPGQGIDEQTDYTNHMIATLEMCLIQKPVWFDLATLDDINLLVKVYRICTEFENSVSSPQRGAAISVGGSQAGSGTEGQQSGAAGSVTAVGRGQVPPTLDP